MEIYLELGILGAQGTERGKRKADVPPALLGANSLEAEFLSMHERSLLRVCLEPSSHHVLNVLFKYKMCV